MVKADSFGRIMENLVNSRPEEGGLHRKASWCAHEGKLYVSKEDAERTAILQENAQLYKERKGKFTERTETAGGYPMAIPPRDYEELYLDNPWLNHCDRKTKADFFKRLYRAHPEYRIG